MLIVLLVLLVILIVMVVFFGRGVIRAIRDERNRVAEFRNIEEFDKNNE